MQRPVDSASEAGPELGELSPAGRRDTPMVDADGNRLHEGIEGVMVERLTAHVDDRGSLMEVLDLRRPFWSEPVVYSYQFTVRPGRIKGWGMHRRQADRYFASRGSLRAVLFDARVESPSHRRFAEFHFSEASPGLLRIPAGVWHAAQNVGDHDTVVVNFPTVPYEHDDPDKHRIDPHSGEIPFDWTLRDG